jgi:hypothetical protein
MRDIIFTLVIRADAGCIRYILCKPEGAIAALPYAKGLLRDRIIPGSNSRSYVGGIARGAGGIMY